jgi:hypothetical protein
MGPGLVRCQSCRIPPEADDCGYALIDFLG